MARLLWLADVLRDAGLDVNEVPGWKTRGAEAFGPVRGITCHATAGSRKSTDQGEISVLLNGSSSAPPPIAQLYLSRSGTWWVVASGRCNHNLVGWGGPNEGLGNSFLLGIEAQNDNKGEPWSAHQLDSYQRGVAALCRKLGLPAARVAAHREHQPGAKTDPHGIDMTAFRARVAALLAEGDDDVGTLEGKQAQQLGDTHFVLTQVPMPNGDRQPAHVVLAGLAAKLDVIARLITTEEGNTRAALLTRLEQLDNEEADRAAVEAQRDAELRQAVEAALSGERDVDEVLRLVGERLLAPPPPAE